MANVLTCDDAYIGQRVSLLLSNRQVVPVVVEVATSGAPTWAQVLAVGNVSGATPPIVSGVTHMEFEGGGAPAQSGDLRVASGWALKYRNTTDTADLSAMEAGSGATNELIIGNAAANTAVDASNGGFGLELRTSATRRIAINSVRIEMHPLRLEWNSGIVNPSLTQQAAGGASGSSLTIAAQSTTSGPLGGTLALRSGNGGAGSTGGLVLVQPGTAGTAGQVNVNHSSGAVAVRISDPPGAHTGGQAINVNGSGLGFFNGTPVTRPSVTGSRGGNTALASLLTTLSAMGLITDNTTA